MLTFSKDGPTADKQMRAVIFYLTTFGYIDGDFDTSEKDYVRSYIGKLVGERVRQGMPDATPELRVELEARFRNEPRLGAIRRPGERHRDSASDERLRHGQRRHDVAGGPARRDQTLERSLLRHVPRC